MAELDIIAARSARLQQAQSAVADSRRAMKALPLVASMEVANPSVARLIEQIWVSIKALAEELMWLSHYMELHDLLHSLQFRCYNFIAQHLRETPKTKQWEDVSEAEFALEVTVLAIRQIANSAPRFTSSLRIAETLDKAHSDLKAALEHQDLRQLQRAARAIKSVLAVEYPKINMLLAAAARSIDFSNVALPMAALLEAGSARAAGSDHAAAVRRGDEAMRQLDEIIRTNTKELELLQKIDEDMRLLDADIDHDLTSAELLWPQVRRKIDELSSLPANPRYVALTKGAEDFDAALRQSDIRKKIASFRRYNSQVGIALFFATTELREVCQKAGDLLSSAISLVTALRPS